MMIVKQVKQTFRISEKDLMIQGFHEKLIEDFFLYQEELLEKRILSTFIKNAILDRSYFVLQQKEEQYNRLMNIIKNDGIDSVLDKLLTPNQANLDILKQLEGILSQSNLKDEIKANTSDTQTKPSLFDSLDSKTEEGIEISEDDLDDILGMGSI